MDVRLVILTLFGGCDGFLYCIIHHLQRRRWSPIGFQIAIIWNKDFLFSLQIWAHQWRIQVPETAAVRRRSALSVSCRWDRPSVSTLTLRETDSSVRFATTAVQPERMLGGTWESTLQRGRSPVLTAPSERTSLIIWFGISDFYTEVCSNFSCHKTCSHSYSGTVTVPPATRVCSSHSVSDPPPIYRLIYVLVNMAGI